ncbi:MAG: chorismate synthase [Candidatus Margulisbacteria bacterium]|nr:chorismate synthase [Candidatus Margulisiibacteriota bacterium]
MRYITAGESHGQALVAILEGCPANLPLSADDIDRDLARRQEGYGRGPRMQIEKDKAEIISGLRLGKTIGSPIAILLANKSKELFDKPFTQLRPGHADLAGALKYDQKDVRNILERASARETAGRVAAGAVCRRLLQEFNINVSSRTVSIGGAASEKEWKTLIDQAREKGDSLGGIFELMITGAPVGLGSYVQWDERLDGNLARAVMAIPGVKGVEIGLGFALADQLGSKVHDEIFYDKKRGFYHKTNNAGGIEGGISNGESIVIRAVMKPISTLRTPLQSVDLGTKAPVSAHVERSDVCAIEAAGIVGEAVAAFEIARAWLEKFGGDSLEEVRDNFSAYQKRVSVL